MVIGFIGLGDVGSRFAGGITRDGGANTIGYDVRLGKEEFQDKEQRCVTCGVELAASMEVLMGKADLVIAATSCADAVKTLEGALPYLREGQYYIDVNSAVPSVKKILQKMVESKGGRFVDGGILDTPMNGWHTIPVGVSGDYAQDALQILNSYGMNLRYIGPEVGQASGLKILRSIFTKGLEALLLETFSAARHYGVLKDVYGSIQEMLEREPICPMFERMVTTDVVHAKRRAKEVGAVADMLRDEDIDATMSQAAYEKLMWSSASGLKEHFGGEIPENYLDVVEYLSALRTKREETL